MSRTSRRVGGPEQQGRSTVGLPITLATTLCTLVLVLAACGSPSTVGNTSSTTKTTEAPASNSHQQREVTFAACVRSHGVANFPDSAIQISSKGIEFSIPPGIDTHSPKFQAALQSCQSLLPAGSSSGHSSSSSVQAILKYSQCMRTHGVANFPEPNSEGLFTGGSGINPNSPAFQSAQTACQHYLPTGAVGG